LRNSSSFELSDRTGQTYDRLAALASFAISSPLNVGGWLGHRCRIAAFWILPFFVIRSDYPDRSPITPAVFLAKNPSDHVRGKPACTVNLASGASSVKQTDSHVVVKNTG